MKKRLVTVKMNAWLTVFRQAKDGEVPDYGGNPDYDAEMSIYEQIGQDYWGESGIGAEEFKNQLDGLKGKKVLLRIHSPGGNVYDSMAMHNAIKEHGGVDTKVDGLAASAASAVFQAGNKRVMSKFSMQMAHKASSLLIGNSQEMSKEAAILQKHDEALAKMYAGRSGKSVEDCMNLMDAETWMDGDECLANKFCDELTDDDSDAQGAAVNKKFDLSKFKHPPEKAARFNQSSKINGAPPASQPKLIMNKEEMIALLISAGVTVANDATDGQLKELVRKNLKPVTAGGAADGAPAAAAVVPPALQARIDALEQREKTTTLKLLTSRVDKCIETDRWPANERQWLIDQATKDTAILDRIEKLSEKPPGFPEAGRIATETDDPNELMKGHRQNMAVVEGVRQGRYGRDVKVREAMAAGAKANGAMCRKIVDRICKGIPDKDEYREARCQAIGAYLDAARMNDAQQGPYGTVTVGANLQRTVIMSEAMRAFRRRLVAFDYFCHKYQNVPLEGSDTVTVPYYPLYTATSLRFTTANGYQTQPTNQQAQDRQITVGGVGGNTKIAGVDRAYQPLQFSSYLLRRQPWVDIAKLTVMSVEQLALDIWLDIINANVVKANFGNAVWTGAPSGFDETSVAALQGVANKKDWPEAMRNLVILTDYYTNLASSPYVKAFLNIGDTGVIREGKIGGLYGFADTIGNPRVPTTSDGNLVGWISYPSAVLIATANILPAPGVLYKMQAFEVITDDQIGLSFTYRYWGNESLDLDNEIVECSYGSQYGELAALGRIVSTGT